MSNPSARIAENLDRVRGQIAAAAVRSARPAAAVRLVAVTKYVGIEAIATLVQCGCRDLGEARPQQLWQRAAALGDPQVRWHLVGQLQRNKVRRTVPVVAMIHSVDNVRLAVEIDRAAAEAGRRTPILLEVNISGERSKSGFAPDQIEPILVQLASLDHVEPCGLMGMSGLESDPDQTRRELASLRQLRDRLAPLCPANIRLAELSMGMSDDFEAAIEEGATIVRIGSALFEGVGDCPGLRDRGLSRFSSDENGTVPFDDDARGHRGVVQ